MLIVVKLWLKQLDLNIVWHRETLSTLLMIVVELMLLNADVNAQHFCSYLVLALKQLNANIS